MEIFNLYSGTKLAYSMIGANIPELFYYALGMAFAVWLGLFVLQGFGLYAMASRRGMKDKWKAFVPFVNIHYIGKLSGDCYFFSQTPASVCLNRAGTPHGKPRPGCGAPTRSKIRSFSQNARGYTLCLRKS